MRSRCRASRWRRSLRASSRPAPARASPSSLPTTVRATALPSTSGRCSSPQRGRSISRRSRAATSPRASPTSAAPAGSSSPSRRPTRAPTRLLPRSTSALPARIPPASAPRPSSPRIGCPAAPDGGRPRLPARPPAVCSAHARRGRRARRRACHRARRGHRRAGHAQRGPPAHPAARRHRRRKARAPPRHLHGGLSRAPRRPPRRPTLARRHRGTDDRRGQRAARARRDRAGRPARAEFPRRGAPGAPRPLAQGATRHPAPPRGAGERDVAHLAPPRRACAAGAPGVGAAAGGAAARARLCPASDMAEPTDFIRQIVADDLRSGKHSGRVVTRFPPEPNGYLHIGHAKSICLNFGIAQKYGGKCNLRFDDTNPTKEDVEYVDSIMEDIRWLGFQWDGLYYASDYFEQLYEWAELLSQKGKAYVCDLTGDQIREYRGTLTKPGRNSPYRERSVEENLDLFRRMRAGEFPDGSRTLRAKIDMASPNLNMRDPVLYRILHAHHHRTGDKWCIYATYDWAHGQSDSIERITHSICTLEFENHRPLYDWCIQELGIYAPQQIEFARLNLTYTVMSKRKLLTLVKDRHVAGWDDPRMPTITGLRRRGYTPEAIRNFCERIGVSKFEGTIDMAWLEDALREDLNKRAPRALAVLRPLK